MSSFLGIQFAPLNVPLHRRLETLAAACWFISMVFGGFIGIFIILYALFYTKYWYLALMYLIWIYVDRDTCNKNGRTIQWVRNWRWWIYCRNYFPVETKIVDGFFLNPNRNYLAAAFPHGVFPIGPFFNSAPTSSSLSKKYPHFKIYLATLSQLFYFPFLRELLLAIGAIGVSSKAIGHILENSNGGTIVGLMPGGAAEAYLCKPGKYRILLKRRKGFIKIALKYGTPLIPAFSFGETDAFNQIENPLLRRLQDWVKSWTGFAPIIPIGRGFFQYSFGIIPRRTKVFTVIGLPIDVVKVENPSKEQIEELHEKFTNALIELFEIEKKNFTDDYENLHLELY